MQVRFSRGEEVYQAISAAVKETLAAPELIPEISLEKKREKPVLPKPKAQTPEPFEVRRAAAVQEPQRPKRPVDYRQIVQPQVQNPPIVREQTVFPKEESAPKKSEQMELFAPGLLTKEARSRHVLIGQVFETYWLVEYEEKFFIIDQHAAHEKVLYERLQRDFREKKISSQYLSPPLILSVNIKEELLLLEYMRMFQKLGFEIEPFGTREYSIHAVPANLYGLQGETLFKELLDSLEKEKTGQELELFAERLASMACKAAVKGNQSLSRQEADQLIEELLALENPYHCPHGRPTIVSMSRPELEKKFKRIV